MKIIFLRYSTGESGMVSELFSFKNFVKILIFRFTIFIFVFFNHVSDIKKNIGGKFPGMKTVELFVGPGELV